MKYILIILLLLLTLELYCQNYGEKKITTQFIEAKGYPEENESGDFDYLLVEDKNYNFIIKNNENIAIEGYKELFLPKDIDFYIVDCQCLKEQKYLYVFYYQTNFDYGGTRICKINLENNKIIWISNFSTLSPGKPVSVDDFLYLSGYQIMYKINKKNGTVLWQTKYKSQEYILDLYASAEIYSEIVIYRDRNDDRIDIVLNNKNGKVIDIVGK
jgi:hypothetical protein